MASILDEVQIQVAGMLSASSALSACPFLVESRKDIEYEIKNALGRQGIVGIVMTPKAQYMGKYEDLFLAWQLDSLEIDIVENPIVNRGKKTPFITGQEAAMKVFDVLCPLSGDYEGQFNPVSYEEGEDSGLLVNKCTLKALVYGEHGDVPQPDKPITYQFVKLLDAPPAGQPHDGWMWQDNEQFFIGKDGQAHSLGIGYSQMSAYVEQQLSSKADLSAIPTKTSQLSNDSGYLTEHQSLEDYYTKSETSSNAQISAALAKKLDKSGGDIAGSLAVAGVVETLQINLRNDSADASIPLSYDGQRSILISDPFSVVAKPAKLPMKPDGTVAYLDDISSAVSSFADQEHVDQSLSSKADLSALDFKRDTLDANFYQDPLASDDAGFKFSVSYAFSPEQELFNGILKKTDSEIPTWTWGQTSRSNCAVIYTDGAFTFTYSNFEDGGGNQHYNTFTLDLKSPKWEQEFSDDYFHFKLDSATTVFATQAWVLEQLQQLRSLINNN